MLFPIRFVNSFESLENSVKLCQELYPNGAGKAIFRVDMPTISFAKNRNSIEVEHGAVLMTALQKAAIPVASSCGGDGICIKCRVQVLEGPENLSPPTDQEKSQRENHGFPRSERLSCQVRVLGPIKIDTTYW